MDGLIKEALVEEAVGAPFPADAWKRQEALLAEAGLFGGTAPAPLRPRFRLGLIGQAATLVALLVLVIGATGFRPWQSGLTPAVPSPASPTSAVEPYQLFDASGAFQLPKTGYFRGFRLRSGVLSSGDADSSVGMTIDRIRQWLADGKVIGRLATWTVAAEPEALDLVLYGGGGAFTLQSGASCFGQYDPSQCYTLVGLPDGSAVMVVQRDLTYWLDGHMWEPTNWATGRKLDVEGLARLTEEQVVAAAQEAMSRSGHPGMVAEHVLRTTKYALHQDVSGRWTVTADPAWNIILKDPGKGQPRATVLLSEADFSSASPFRVISSYYPTGFPPNFNP